MPTTTDYNFGDVVLVPFPFTDQSTSKKRPAVIASSAFYHRNRADVILMAITSQTTPVVRVAEASIQRWKEAGLLMPSVLKPVLATVDRGLIIKACRVSCNPAHTIFKS
jgi:PemK-like, MazF-like toxin of type II toxin-antitoxin system